MNHEPSRTDRQRAHEADGNSSPAIQSRLPNRSAEDQQASITTPHFVDATAFRSGMRQLTGAVCIVATATGSEKAGLTATAVCSVSAQPPRLLVCINRSGRSSGIIRSAGVFSVNVLADKDQSLAERFSRSSDNTDARFEQGGWRAGTTGTPILNSSLVSFECRIHQVVDTGTHGIIFGDVVAVHIGQVLAGPLLYANGRFSRLEHGRDSILEVGW